MEVRERQETGNIREEISREFPLNLWTDEEARRVGEFLLGRAGEVKTVPDGALGVEPAKIEEGKLVTFAESLLSGTKAAKPVEPADQFGLIETAAEHRYVNIEMARTAIRVTLAAMEKQGLLRDVVVRFQGRGGMRLRDKKAYSYESVKGEEFDPLKYPWLDPSLYGRWVNLYVRAPVFEYEGEGGVKRQRRFGNERLRNSIGHEVGHLVRDVMGGVVWQGLSVEEAARLGLLPSQNFEGAYKVAGNKSGSEGIENYLSRIIEVVASGQEATISSLIPAMAQKLSENLIKKVEETKIRQTLTVTLDHLVQLERLGYGEASAIRLLAMGLMGYVTYEKMPQLIDAGIIDKQRVDGLEKVLSTMIRWMTDQSVEKGFRL